ncbi:MAG TPA: sigma 54-interacting transcriptional regulator [Polyangiaceae bacterium]
MPDREDPNTRTVHAGAPGAVLRIRAVKLHVKNGADKGRRIRVAQPSFVVGSGEGADLRLADPTVSREHLRLSLTPEGVRLRDDGSKNGTRIGKLRFSDALLTEDAIVQVGGTSIAVALERDAIELPLSVHATFGEAIGASAAMRHLFATLEQAAQTEVTILVEGESGVGKEVLARAIHARSGRADGPFVVVDCGAIPRDLFESEVFGHVRGAFTGATETRAGLFDEANGGTVFLDEVGELPLELQPKLLRALEQREVRPVGARGPHPVDVRVVAATNRRLAEASTKGEFREDLFYRLAVVRVTVPPLRERPEDVVPLANAFLRTLRRDPAASLPADLQSLLVSHPWPGNVRELRNVIERFAVLGSGPGSGLLEDAGPRAASVGTLLDEVAELPYHEARRIVVERFEREYLPRLLSRTGGVVTRAAEEAQLGRASLYRMMERLRIGGVED